MKTNDTAKFIIEFIKRVRLERKFEELGTILEVGDGIVKVGGLPNAMLGETLEFPDNKFGLALNLDKKEIGAVLLGETGHLEAGDVVRSTGKILQVPVGEELLGRVVNPLGFYLDEKGPIRTSNFRPVESKAPEIIDRMSVNQPLQTGILSIDSMIPIGRGQRELIIGDRDTGKSSIVLDTLINQREKNIYCIYVSIGQKASSVAEIIKELQDNLAMEKTIIVSSPASDPVSLQFLAPYAGCAMGEYFMYNGEDALIIYDDLSKHAVAYRELSLLLGKPPGREAYPGDIFYIHSRLLERAAKLSEERGGGSLTAIPVVETQEGDVTTFIPTNIISISDGQIYLNADLFYEGIRPAIDVGISVSRVGGSAQIPAMKKVAGKLRLHLAQYRELEAFTQFGVELDLTTKKRIEEGKRLVEILKQKPLSLIPVEDQVVILYVAVNGYLDDIDISEVKSFTKNLLVFMKENFNDIFREIREDGDLTFDLETKLNEAITKFKSTNETENI